MTGMTAATTAKTRQRDPSLRTERGTETTMTSGQVWTAEKRRIGVPRVTGARRTRPSPFRSGVNRSVVQQRVEDDEVPMLDWFKEEREASRRRERKRRTIAALIFVLALVPAGVAHLYFKYRTPPPPPPSPTERSKVVAKPDPFKTMKTRKRPTGRRATVKKQEEIDRRLKKIERLREDLLNIAPDTYGSVRLQLVSGRYVDETNLAAEDELTVRAIQIHVISEKWDAMSSADKIKLLRVTYSMLRARYPALTQFVSLRFDDGRKDLDLRFDDDELVVE